MMDKQEFRKTYIAKRDSVDEKYIQTASRMIFDKICELDIFKDSKTILTYIPFGSELDTISFLREGIARGIRMLTPICHHKDRTMTLALTTGYPDDFVKTRMGILEIPIAKAVPVPPEEVDFILVPGVAFTAQGNRIGYGGGYYDRLFEKVRGDCMLAAAVLDEFLVKDIPLEAHDRTVDFVFTEKRNVFVRSC